MAEFLSMGGHGFYIWTSYAIVTVVLVFSFIKPISQLQKIIRDLGQLPDSTGNKQ